MCVWYRVARGNSRGAFKCVLFSVAFSQNQSPACVPPMLCMQTADIRHKEMAKMHKRKQSHGVLPLDDGNYDVSFWGAVHGSMHAAGMDAFFRARVFPPTNPHTYTYGSTMQRTSPGRTTSWCSSRRFPRSSTAAFAGASASLPLSLSFVFVVVVVGLRWRFALVTRRLPDGLPPRALSPTTTARWSWSLT